MKVHTAVTIGSILLLLTGLYLYQFDIDSKWFHIAPNFIATGLAVLLTSFLVHVGGRK